MSNKLILGTVQFGLKYGINNIRWDELESEYQRNDTRRLLMFKTSYSDKGKYIIGEIDKFLK